MKNLSLTRDESGYKQLAAKAQAQGLLAATVFWVLRTSKDEHLISSRDCLWKLARLLFHGQIGGDDMPARWLCLMTRVSGFC